MHPGEYLVAERLATDRQTVDAGVPPGVDGFGGDVFRIRLERDFGMRYEIDSPSNRVDEACDAVTAEPGRRSTAEIKRVDRPIPPIAEPQIELATQGGRVLIDGNDAPDRDGEIAIGAAARAKRDVDVEMTRKHHEI
jgi:hypothetical protein